MDDNASKLKRKLKEAGFNDPLIDAAWPDWWSDDASMSESARAELRFSIARKLGLSAASLYHDEVTFMWKDEARFKHLANDTDEVRAILTSFGISVARLLLRGSPDQQTTQIIEAKQMREVILRNRSFVDLQSLLATCWALGIPVIHLRVFPQRAKRMHAMVAKIGNGHAILLARDSQYPADIAFTLAHEIGHVMLGHISTNSPIVDGDVASRSGDPEEESADAFAMELLIGTSSPAIQTNIDEFNSVQLAQASLSEGPKRGIEPGTLALCLAYDRGIWPIAMAALPFIYSSPKPVWREVNNIARTQLRLKDQASDSSDFLMRIMGLQSESA